MPAEEHVEPGARLPDRGSRGRSADRIKAEAKPDAKSESKPESAPAAATAAPAAEPAAQPAAKAAAGAPAKKPSSAQVAAIRSACRADYQKTCAGVPTGGAAALNCLETNKSKLSAGCQQAVNAAGGGGAVPAAGGGAAQPPPVRAAVPATAPADHSAAADAATRGAVRRCGRHAAAMSARCAAGSHPAAAASCNAWRRRPPRCRPPARTSWPRLPHDNPSTVVRPDLIRRTFKLNDRSKQTGRSTCARFCFLQPRCWPLARP